MTPEVCRAAGDFAELLERFTEPLASRDYLGAERAVVAAGFRRVAGSQPVALVDVIVRTYITAPLGNLLGTAAAVLGAGWSRGERHGEREVTVVLTAALESGTPAAAIERLRDSSEAAA